MSDTPEPVVVLRRLEVSRNSDLIEGRGSQMLRSVHEPDDLDGAHAAARGISTQGEDGHIHLVTYSVAGLEMSTKRVELYGRRRLPDGRYGVTWVPGHPRASDTGA